MSEPTSNHPIRILVVDDHPVVRDGLVAMLSTQPDFEVVAEASGGQEAVQLARQMNPDIVLLDLEMPELDGVEALRQMRSHQPALRALVFTAFDTDERILNAIQAGAQGYLLKGAPREELFQAIRVVAAGSSLLQPVVASKLLQQIRGLSGSYTELPAMGEHQLKLRQQLHDGSGKSSISSVALTEREKEVLRLMGQGKANKEIAYELTIAERTVKFHVSSILAKLGASNRTEAVTLAAQIGLIELKPPSELP